MVKIYFSYGKHSLDLLKSIPVQEQNNKTLLLTADIYLYKWQFFKSRSFISRLFKPISNQSRCHQQAGKTTLLGKKYDEAIQLYQKILDKNPQDIQVRRQYARVLMWMGNEEDWRLNQYDDVTYVPFIRSATNPIQDWALLHMHQSSQSQ